MSALQLSVIIITYNSAGDIDACLDALMPLSELLEEIIVIDNASVDSTCTKVEQYPSVRLIRRSENSGFAAGVNRGVASCASEYFLVLNPDVIVNVTAVTALLTALKENNEYAALGCRMVYPSGRQQMSCRQFPTIATFLGRALRTNSVSRALFSWFSIDDHDVRAPDPKPKPVDWILGGCMMIRRTAYNAIGPFDQAYFLYYEDIDWCYRAHLEGWKIGYSSCPYVVHDYRRSSSRLSVSNRLMWVHLNSACRFFIKTIATRGLRVVF